MNLKKFSWIFVVWLGAALMAYGQSWTTAGVGSLGVTGSSAALSGSSFSVAGSGADIGGTADALEFVYQPMSGDGQIVARVVSAPTSDPWSKAGVMMRESLNANARNATLVVSRDNGIEFSTRKTVGGSTTANAILAGRQAPQWLKLIRSGSNFSAYVSVDGVAWALVGSDTISMASTVYVGMAVTSHKNTALGSAVFEEVALRPGTVSDGAAPQPPVLAAGACSNGSVALGWSGAGDDVGIASYSIVRNGVVVATVPGTASSYIDNGLTASTPYSYSVKAMDASGKVSEASNSVDVGTTEAGAGMLDASLDIGSVGKAGSAVFVSGSAVWTLQGAGAYIGGSADAFRFGYQPCNGDTVVTVRVASVQAVNSSSKAGVMIRGSLDANAPEASVLVSNSSGVVFQSRKSAGGATASTATYAYPSISSRRAPQWVRLVRHGNDFKGYVSADGVSWEFVGGDTVALPEVVYAGIGVSSYTTSTLCSAVFSNLDISPLMDAANPSIPAAVRLYGLSDVSLSLSWTPARDDVAVDGYRIFEDGTCVGITPFARFTDTFQNPGTTHNYTIQAVDAAGNLSAVSEAFAVTLKPVALPSPWQHDDIGDVDWAGSASFDNGTFGVSGAGVDIDYSGPQDSFHYIYQPLTSDKTIVARVVSIPNPPNTSVKAGVMIRESLEPGARNAMVMVLGGTGTRMQYRTAENTTGVNISGGDASAKAPYWVKLVRGGTHFAGYLSPDGTNWMLSGTCTVPMATSAYVGLALTSHDPRVLAAAKFDSVQIVADSDNNGLSDGWEVTWFNKIGVDPNAIAARNDGLTNLQAFQQGVNPVDFFNGVAPVITKLGGDSQNGAINTVLNAPLSIRVTSAGVPLVNAPVTVTVPAGGGLISTAPGAALSGTSVFHSDANGQVSVYYQEGSKWRVSSQIKFVAGKTYTTFAATASPQVGRWAFASHTATTTPDNSNTGNIGNVIGGVAWTTGFDGGGAVALDGSSAYLEATASPTMALGAEPVSITAWIKLPQNLPLTDESNIYPVATLGDGISDGLSLSVRGGGHGVEAVLNTAYGAVTMDGNVDAGVLADGFWHQVGFVSDGTGNVSVVFDGAIVATRFGYSLAALPSARLWLGRDSAGRYFKGSIDEVELRRDALLTSDVLARYNVDGNKDGMADRWEWKYFGTLSVSGTADSDGDGVSNLQEFKNGTSPKDYFNGAAPVLAKVSGDNQNGAPGLFLPQGLTVKVSDANGNPLPNAPVTFSVQAGGGVIALSSTAATSGSLALRTGADGTATVYYKSGPAADVQSQIQVTAGLGSCTFVETDLPDILPDPWKQADVGPVKYAGSGSFASGTFGITASGVDIWGTQDQFHYVYQSLNGDMTIVARVVSIPNPPDPHTKAGVMIRETLDTGAREVMVLVTGSTGAALQSRSAVNAVSTSVAGANTARAPYWIKLVRAGTKFAGYQSADGVTWTLVGTTTVSMGAQASIGLAVTSHNSSKVASATFDSVQMTTDSDGNGLPDAWELTYFNQVGLDPNALAPRNDGLTIMQAFQQGLNPADFYNSIAPKLTKMSGDNQNGAINAPLNQPLVLRVTGTDGTPLVNAPVAVTVAQGGGLVSIPGGESSASALVLHTDASGLVSISYQEGSIWNVTSKIQIAAGKSLTIFAATAAPRVGYWSFNSHTGTTTPDSSNTGNVGNVIGGVTWVTGFDGTGAIVLDGTTGYFEASASPTMALGSGPVSVTAWVRCPQNLPLNDEASIYPLITMGSETSDGLSLCLRGGGHGLQARLNTSSGVVAIDATGTTLADGYWHQVGFIYDGNGSASVVFDGQLVATQAGVQIAPIATPRVWLGRDLAGNAFAGAIDEVEVRRDALAASDVAARYNVDSNKDKMADWWEWRYFGTLKVTGTADGDKDGISNLAEYVNGSSPTDYFNATAPNISKVSGDNQNGAPGCCLAKGLCISVADANGNPLANAPVNFNVLAGGGYIATGTTATTKLTTLAMRTGSDGRVSAFYKEGGSWDVDSQIQVTAGGSDVVFSVSAKVLVGQWNFEEANGVTTSDSSRTGNTLTLNGGVSWDKGYDGNGAVALDGASGSLSTPVTPTFALGGTNAVSAAAWVRFPASLPLDDANEIHPVLSFGSSTADALVLFVRGGVGSASVVLNKGTTAIASATFERSTIADGAWHHVGFSSDGHGNVNLVFDGMLLASKTGVSISTASSSRLWLGRDASGHYFKGGLDDAVVRREALTQTDFQNLYNVGMANGGLPNWWKWKTFGTLDVDPNAQPNGDGVSNLQKYQAESAPVVAAVGDILDLPAGRGVHGQVLWERWAGPELLNTSVEDIRRFGKYPLNPGETRNLPTFEIQPVNGKLNSASRLRAYVTAPSTGMYTFYVTGRDSASLYVSLSGKSYERQLACSASNVAPNVWTKPSAPFYLEAGQRYYLELIVKSERFTGYGQVGWITPANATPKLIPSEYLQSMGVEDDTNDVGMSDEWQIAHFGSLGQWSNQDPDFDGLTNLQEFHVGTDPLHADTGNTGVSDAGKALGYLTYDYWLNVSGTSVADFLASERYTQVPDGRSVIANTAEPSILSQKYASVLRGYFVPGVSGNYGFQSKAGTDGVAAFLSTDENPDNRTLLFDKLATPATRTLVAGQRYYFELVHKVETGTQAASLLWLPPGATSYVAADPAKFVPLNAKGISPQGPLPMQWQRGEIFVNRGWLTYPGRSNMDTNGTLEIVAAGKSVNSHSDGLHWVYQALPDGGQVQARVLGCDWLSSSRTAGLMIRQGLQSGAAMAMLRTNPSGSINFSCRLVQDGYATNDPAVAYTGPMWMRLVRKGGSVYAYTSQDGNQWALFDQAVLNLTGTAYVGIFATSGSETQICRATFDNVSAGIDSTVAASYSATDSDGDGYSDYEETQFLHSDPLVADLSAPSTVSHLAGSNGVASVGTWSTDGGATYNVSVRGAVDYKVTAPRDGVFRLAIQGTPRVNTLSNTGWDVLVSVDGQYIETAHYELALGQTGIAYVYTPWLTAGSHTVRLYLDNVSIYRSFAFNSVDLQKIDGADANSNGIPDWMENRLAAQNGLNTAPAVSRTSPFCLEGTARYQQTAKLAVDGTSVAMIQGIGDGWYANVPLNSGTSVTVQAAFENGSKVDQKNVTWISTNVLNSGIPDNTLKVRKGDALLLAAAPADATSGTAAITVTQGEQTAATLQTSGTQTASYRFDQAGTYTLNATYQDGTNAAITGTLTVQVMDAAFAKPDPFLTLGYAREWINPLLPADAVVQSDSRMEVIELAQPAAGGRDFRLRMDAAADRIMLARLNDGTQNGPILDRAVISGVNVCSGAQTGIYLVEQYSDGSRLVEMRLLLSELPDDFRAKLEIFAAGVTFEDGTTVKWVTKADFDSTGQLKVRFIMAPNSYTSICHRLYIYQGDTLLETRTN